MPTPYFSQDRPTLANGRPCWLDSQVALPTIQMEPLPDGNWRVFLMDGCGGWADKETPTTGLQWILSHWLADPELTLLEIFRGSLPRTTRWLANTQEVELNPEDLGL